RSIALALQDHDVDCRLVVLCGAEGLGTTGGDGGVAFDDLGHQATHRLHSERQRGHVEEEDVLDLSLDDGGLNGCSDCHHFIGIDCHVRVLASGEASYQV